MGTSAADPRAPTRPRRWRRAYLLVAGALLVAATTAKLLAPAAGGSTFLVVLTVLWLVPGVYLSVRWAWRKLTYRVGVRLLISYFLIGLTPFALAVCIAAIAGYILVGQYGTVRLSEELGRHEARFAVAAHAALQELSARGPTAADAVLRRLLYEEGEAGLRLQWLIVDGPRAWPSAGAERLTIPSWAAGGAWRGPVVVEGTPGRAVIEREGERAVAIVMPLDAANSRTLGRDRWFSFRSVSTEKAKGGIEGFKIEIGEEGRGGGESGVWVNGKVAPPEEVEAEWLGEKPVGGTFWSRARLLWFWEMKRAKQWDAAASDDHAAIVTLVRVHVGDAIKDFFASSENLSAELGTLVRVVLWFFGSVYLIAVAFAVVMILRVTHSTARLTRGARAVARGDLDYRIKVTRHDQLGELGVAFNSMTSSVCSMLDQIAEKERMARELELAREIQESLLPPKELTTGPLVVVAYFRPAGEVGGDYFDLFPLGPGRLIATIGDVAGHGLPTGLLMAMVKSAVAALVEEGWRGGQLLARLNRLLLGQRLRQKMASFALAEVDAVRGEIAITSAGHPPAVLLATDGKLEEVLLASLPLGHRWPDPPPCQVRPFPPGSRLLLYSDGLIEARNTRGEAFGYDALRATLETVRHLTSRTMLDALLSEVDRHRGSQPLDDDLTVLVVEHLRSAT